MTFDVSSLLESRQGHFVFESGHHGAMWLELDLLFHEPDALGPYVNELAKRIAKYSPEIIVGPMVEGALLALLVARKLKLPYAYINQIKTGGNTEYTISPVLAKTLTEKKVAIIDDVINAGSAVKKSIKSLKSVHSNPIVLGAFLAYGNSANKIAEREKVSLEVLEYKPNRIFEAQACPLCEQKAPFSNE